VIQLEQTSEGILLPVQAHARARKNALVGNHASRLKVSVRQAPEKGKANVAIAKLLANSLGLRPSQIELRSGSTSTKKVFLVTGIDLTELRVRISTCLDDDAL